MHNVDLSQGIEVFVDANFTSLWTHETALDPNSIFSWISYVIMIFGYSLFWQSKLQTEIALSTTESEYITMS